MSKMLTIVGIGPGNEDYLTKQSRGAIEQSKEIYAFDRVKDLFAHLNDNIQTTTLSQLVDKIEQSTNDEITVLLSGDVNFYSATKYLQRHLKEGFYFNLLPGLTSYQILCSKVKLSYEKMKFVSLHGLNSHYLGQIMANEHIFLLCDQVNSVSKVLHELKPLKHLKIYIGEDLGMKTERIIVGKVSDIKQQNFSPLAVLIIENKQFIELNETLYDTAFVRAKVPMTKQEIRWLVTSLFDFRSTDVVYDVGAGSGSLSIAMARRVSEGHVYAIEKNEDAFALLNENVKQLQAYNVSTYFGCANEIIDELETPTKVFIGGSGRELEKVIKKVIARSKDVTFIITCITIETQNSTIQVFNDLGIEYDVYSINSARSKKIASYHMMYANNPITIIKGVFSHES